MCILALGVMIVASVLVFAMFSRMSKLQTKEQMSNEIEDTQAITID